MKKTKSWYRKKGCELAKKIRRTQTPHCEMCGKRNCKIEGHHLLTVGAYPNMSNQLDNIIVLCVHCHKFGKVSMHGTPDLMMDKFHQKYPGRYARLRKQSQERKPDYEAEYKELKQLSTD